MCPTPASNKIGKGPAQIQTTRSSKIETCILKCPIPDLDFERLPDELQTTRSNKISRGYQTTAFGCARRFMCVDQEVKV